MKLQKLFTVCLSIPVIFFTVMPAWSAFELHPWLSLEEEYNDNIHLSAENEQEDWITTIEPGISLTYGNRSVDVSADYSLRYRFYKNNDEDNLEDFEDIQRAETRALFFDGRPFTVRLFGVISRETLDERDDNEFNDLQNLSTVYQLNVSPEYAWRLTSTFSLVFGYGYERRDYVESAGNDSEDHSGSLRMVKLLSSSTEVFANYRYTVHQSEDEEEYDRQDTTLGFVYQLGANTTLSAEGGYSQVEYDSGFEADSTNWLVDVSYRLSGALSFAWAYSQDFSLTAADGLTKSREATFTGNYEKGSVIASTGVFWNQSDYVRENREDERTGVRLGLTKALARNLSLILDAEYEKAQFDDATADEDVDRITLGASLDYLYRRITASLGYRYRNNDSDINANDYQNNILILSASLRF